MTTTEEEEGRHSCAQRLSLKAVPLAGAQALPFLQEGQEANHSNPDHNRDWTRSEMPPMLSLCLERQVGELPGAAQKLTVQSTCAYLMYSKPCLCLSPPGGLSHPSFLLWLFLLELEGKFPLGIMEGRKGLSLWGHISGPDHHKALGLQGVRQVESSLQDPLLRSIPLSWVVLCASHT